MALTKKEHEDLLKEIASSGGDTDNMLKLLQKLRDDFDEREGMLRKEGETRDKDTPSTPKETKEIREESREDNKEDGGLRRDPIKGKDIPREDGEYWKRKYIERFFSSGEEAIRDNDEDVKKDDDVKDYTYEKLFKEREG